MQYIKRFLPYGIAIILMFFSFIFMSIPYVGSRGVTLSGYEALSLWTLGWSGILVSIFQLFELLLMVCLLLAAFIGIILEAAAILTAGLSLEPSIIFKGDRTKSVFSKTVKLMILVNLCLDFLILILLIVFAAVNRIGFNAGLILKLVFDIGAVVGLTVAELKLKEFDKNIHITIETDKKE